MSSLRFKSGEKVTVLDSIQKQGEYGWETEHIESEGLYHSHDINGAWVQIERSDRLVLCQYPFNLVFIKLEK